METTANQQLEHRDAGDRALLGFWIYLMTDLIMFAVLFAAFAVLRNNTFGGPSGAELFSMPFVLAETIILLMSSFTCGLMTLSANSGHVKTMALWLTVTFALGVSFLSLEFTEFSRLIAEGNSWTRSAFLSSFFGLVGTHGLHITAGLLWASVLAFGLWFRGLTSSAVRKLTLFSMFWHFLDIVWIFIFTIVYLLSYV